MFKSRTMANLVMGLVLLGATLTPASDLAFTHVQIGDAAPELRLVEINGDIESYLGSEDGKVSVFAFVKIDSQRSENIISQWAGLQKKFTEQPVQWSLIISNRHQQGNAALWDSLSPRSTVLTDSGDLLYSKLGVVMTPCVGIVDKEGLLQAYIPYRKINYPTTIEAHLKHILGQITESQLQAALNPSGHVVDSLESGARRKLKLGKMLLKRGKLDSALIQVEKALVECPDLRDGYLLLAEIHTAANRPDEAQLAHEKAVQLSCAQADSTASNNTHR